MKIKITAVNYLNTYPFRYGLDAHKDILQWAEIDYATPFECAEKLIKGTTNIALAPVAVLAYQPQLKIISDYCLSTNKIVQTVKLYSKKKIQDIQSIVLDYQSLSSVSLVKVLMKFFWKKNVQYIQGEKGFENLLNADAMVVIGDRTFELNGKFEYEYDLAEQWFNFYQKPFVFAAWISNIELPSDKLQQLNQAFAFGIQQLDKVTEHIISHTNILNFLSPTDRRKTINDYLNKNIQFVLNDERKASIEYFLKLLKEIVQEPATNIL